MEPHEMPVDKEGIRADVIMDPGARNNRMNIGGLYEIYFNSAADRFARKLRKKLGVTEKEYGNVFGMSDAVIDPIYTELLFYYSIFSTRMLRHFSRPGINKREELAYVVKDGIYLYLPPENEVEFLDIVDKLENVAPPLIDKVVYTDSSGTSVETDEEVLIGSMYFILLEKTGHSEWIAINSGTTTHFGILAPTPQHLRDTKPAPMHAVRVYGESEVRLLTSYAGEELTAEVLDRNNNPAAHKEAVISVLTADKPTNIKRAIDRTKVPLGGGKPLMLLKHLLSVFGIRMKYVPKD